MISAHRAGEAAPAVAVSQQLCDYLAEGLHAAAQPLTILQASLAAEQTDAMQAQELRELARTSATEVQRVCVLFHHLQQLVVAEGMEPQLAPVPLLPLVQHVVDGVYLLFEQDGIGLRWMIASCCPLLLLDRGRTVQALTNVLLAAHAVSSRNDTIEVVISWVDLRALRIVVRKRDEPLNVLGMGVSDTELCLCMAVAQANIRSQHGAFSWTLQPFRVDMELRQAGSAGSER